MELAISTTRFCLKSQVPSCPAGACSRDSFPSRPSSSPAGKGQWGWLANIVWCPFHLWDKSRTSSPCLLCLEYRICQLERSREASVGPRAWHCAWWMYKVLGEGLPKEARSRWWCQFAVRTGRVPEGSAGTRHWPKKAWYVWGPRSSSRCPWYPNTVQKLGEVGHRGKVRMIHEDLWMPRWATCTFLCVCRNFEQGETHHYICITERSLSAGPRWAAGQNLEEGESPGQQDDEARRRQEVGRKGGLLSP